MKLLLSLALICAVASAKPMDEIVKTEKSIEFLKTKNEKNETELKRNNQMSSETEEKESKIYLNPADDKSRSSYDSMDQNNNSPMNSPTLTRTQNIKTNYPERSVVSRAYPIVSMVPSYRSYGLGSGSFDSFSQPMFQSSSYPYGLRPGSYGLPRPYESSISNEYLESSGSPGPYGSSGSLGSYGSSGSLESYGSSESLGSYGSAVIPTSYSSSIPCHNGINIAQQIIHKPVVTELQEVIHKPIISELQEIVNKPVISEIQQVIHKPLFTEHIGFGPSYHGYQKHIVKQPIYQKPTKHFVHQPMAQGGTINLADKYEHAINSPQNIYGPETSSPCGYSGTYIQPNAQYGSVVSTPSVASYQPVYSSGITNEVSTNFAPSIQSSTPCRYDTNPSAKTSYRYAAPAPIGYPTQTLLASNGYVSVPSSELYEQKASILNSVNEELNRNSEEKLQPIDAAHEQIMYDKIEPYKLQSNFNQQYVSSFQQQPLESQKLGRNSIEDIKNIKMNVEAIAKQIEKNPELRKELLKIITEHTYVDEKITQTNKKQDKTIQ